ncbi:hypothetical protein EMIHUDRAFT_364709 [Emiliania huxleyi CCMP1516]|nr:hypothetical protein EMIHUDRAFT_364709 [Emiliania huxleyi CCMP1516]EOD31836.1 hypothetical protein EMIHUDRAFT_364709 [Emiliania huxleyi CCMP1516]|eukprot:XP_005784265.1 hypothetical protein EMIHUDRAFT_364709 [Emiliania huxleyi CCMP1516]
MVPDGEVGTLTIYDRMGPWQCEFSSLRFSDWGHSVRANPAYKEGSTQENEKKKTITAGRVEPNSLPSCMLKYIEDPDTDAYATYRDLSSDERKSRVFQTLNNMKRKSDLGKPAAGTHGMEGKVRKSSCEGAATMFNCGFTVDIGAITVMYRDLH